MRTSYAARPDADFILHAGDMVNRGSRDFEWAEWFKAVSHIHGMVPALPVAGNHEYERIGLSPNQSDRVLSIFWRPQFTLPIENELSADLHEVVYDVRYSEDVHLFVLSTQSPKLEEQAQWLDEQLQKSDALWKIVAMHHPVFSSGRDRDEAARRDLILPVLLRHNVDLVLQGHDHTYARGAVGLTPGRIGVQNKDGTVQTMFVNSVSGPKQYPFNDNGWDMFSEHNVKLERRAENTPFYQLVEIDKNSLRYQARTALDRVYDEFEMTKSDGIKTIAHGTLSTMDERTFENTGEYPGVDELQ